VKRGFEQRHIALLLLLAGFALRTWNLGARSLWYDEAYLWWSTTQLPFSKMIELSMGELVPPMHYFLLRAWIPLAGTSEFALRFPSVLYGLIALAAMARLARRLTGNRSAATWALFLGAVATPLIWASRETRMYGAFIAWCLVAGMALIETLFASNPHTRRRYAWLWGGAVLGAIANLTLSAFWLIGQVLFAVVVLARKPWSTTRSWIHIMIPPAAIAGLLFLPWLIGALPSLGANATYWEGYLPVAEFLRISIAGMTGTNYLPAEWGLTAGGLILLVALPTLLIARHRTYAGLYPLLQLLPLGVIAFVFRNLPKWGSRHASSFAPLPALALAISWGLTARIHNRSARVLTRAGMGLCSLVFVAISVPANINLLANPTYATEDWRGVAHYITEQRATDDVVIVETGSVFPAWAYYAGFGNLLPLPDDELLNVNNILDYTNSTPELNLRLQKAQRVWLVTWLDHITDPTGIIPALLDDIGTELPTPQFHGLGLRLFALERRPEFPSTPQLTTQPKIPTLPGLFLWGYRLPETHQTAGSALDIWTFWMTENPDAHDDRFYQLTLRLLDARGDEWGRYNGTPGSGDYRPSRWRAGIPVLGRYPLIPDPWTPPGIYTPTLTVAIAEGATATVILKPVTLLPSESPPALPTNISSVEQVNASEQPALLQLLGVWLARNTVFPCDTIEGWAFWESRLTIASGERHELRFALNDHTAALPVMGPPSTVPLPAGTRFATQFRVSIACRALDSRMPLTITLLTPSGAALGQWRGPEIHIDAGRKFDPPAGLLPANGDFGANIATLLGYQLQPEPRAEEAFTITLYWRAGETGETPYNVFVHVVPPDNPGTLIAQHDSWPALGVKPTNTWVPGEIIADAHPLAGLPAGDYHLRVGLYNADSRLPVTSGTTTTSPEDAVIIPIHVEP